MIKNQAVVNEENTSDKYWKDRYFREIGLIRANTLPNPTLLDHNISLRGNQVITNNGGSCSKNDEKMMLEA